LLCHLECGSKILGAVKTSIYIYLVPVITVLTSVIVLGEVITGMTALGALMTMVGLFISKNEPMLKNRVELS